MSSSSIMFGRFSLNSLLLGLVIGIGLGWILGSFLNRHSLTGDDLNSPQNSSVTEKPKGMEAPNQSLNPAKVTNASAQSAAAIDVQESVTDGLAGLNERFEQALLLPVGMARSNLLLNLVSEACRYSPKLAFDEFLPELDGLDAHNALSEIAVSWSESDPLGALEGAKTLGDEEATTVVAELALFQLAKTDPTQTLLKMQDFEGMIGNESYSNLRNGFLAGWAMASPEAALVHVNNMATDSASDKERYITTVVGNGAMNDPITTLTAVQKNLTGPSLENALKITYSAWATTDPAAAAKSVEKMPAGPTADELVVNIAREWSQYDPQTTIEWVENAANISDTARQELLENLKPSQPEALNSEPSAKAIPE